MLKWKKLVLGVCVLAVLLVMVGSCTPKPAAAPTIVLRMAIDTTAGDGETIMAEWFRDEIYKRTNGRLQIDIYPGGQLGNIMDLLKLCQTGVVDMSNPFCGIHIKELPLSNSATMPYIARAIDANSNAMMELYKTYPPLRDEYERKNNVKALAFASVSLAVGHSMVPIKKVEDFKGRKLRTFGHMATIVKAAGGTPVAIQQGEVYEAIKKGVLDASSAMPFDQVHIKRLYEVSKYIFDYGIGQYAITVIIMNLDTWNKLPKDIQETILEVTEKWVEVRTDIANRLDAEAIKVFKAAGIELYSWSPEEKAKLKALVLPGMWNDFLTKVIPPDVPAKDFFEKFKALCEKYDKASKYKDPFTR